MREALINTSDVRIEHNGIERHFNVQFAYYPSYGASDDMEAFGEAVEPMTLVDSRGNDVSKLLDDSDFAESVVDYLMEHRFDER